MAEQLPHAKLLIIGPVYEKHLLGEIEQFIAERALGDRVIYGGATSGAQKYYAMADAFVSASFFEGGPLNFLEALRANLPIIATNVGPASHFRGIPGIQLIEPPVDITEFRGAIWQLASTPAFEERLAAGMVKVYCHPQRPNLPADLLQAFDKSNTYRLYLEIIQDLLQGHDVRGKTFTSSWPCQLEKAVLNGFLGAP